MKTFILDRIHNGNVMAEGARVEAENLSAAIKAAKKLFPEPEYCLDSFVLRGGVLTDQEWMRSMEI
jgi:hypothetical protein